MKGLSKMAGTATAKTPAAAAPAAAPAAAAPAGIVDFKSLVITPTKSGYESLKNLTGSTVVLVSLAKVDSDGNAVAADAKGTYVAIIKHTDEKGEPVGEEAKYFVPESKARKLDTGLTLAKGNLVRFTVKANEKRGFTIE